MRGKLSSLLLASTLTLNSQGCVLMLEPLFDDEKIDYIRPSDPDYAEKCIVYVWQSEVDKVGTLAQYLRKNHLEEVRRCEPFQVYVINWDMN